MSKIAEFLRSHISGEVTAAPDVRRSFAKDGSIVEIQPQVVVYPRTEQDIRKVARFSWQLAEKGKAFPVLTRGAGSSWNGAGVGDGISIIMTSHMHKILELDTRKGEMLVEAGAIVGKLQQALITHGAFLPFEPLSSDFATIGGVIATAASGLRDLKYGGISEAVESLRVVLSNGEIIDTKRLSKREVRKKMGLTTFEGDIYRSVDALFQEHGELINSYAGLKGTAGYNVFDVKQKDGSVDLTPLFLGAVGTLGIVTSAKVKTTAFNPMLSQLAIAFYSFDEFMTVAPQIIKLSPSVFSVLDSSALEVFAREQPLFFQKRFGDKIPELMVLVEWDEFSARSQKKAKSKLRKILAKTDVRMIEMSDEKSREDHAKLFRIPSILFQTELNQAKATPGFESVRISKESIKSFLAVAKDIFDKNDVPAVFWWEYATDEVRCFPYFDLRKLGHRQKCMQLLDEYYTAVLAHGGEVAATGGGGRIASLYARQQFGDVLYGVMEKVKTIFDPYNTLNPGIKINPDPKLLQTKMLQEYTLGYFNNHLYK